ncbi:MAG: DUF2786 domain-containing protein [Myxococcales bacterium]|nr:DUF2786 domain-containing protein [Myxococcales bacterium]
MAIDAPILDRVRKLLALASSPNVHEAASAAAMAQALIERHRLQSWLDARDEQSRDPIEDGLDAPLEVARKIRTWKRVLAAALASANGCIAYTRVQGDGEAVIVAGRAVDRQAVLELWGWIVKRIEWLSATHGAGRSRKWHDSFRVGAAAAVGERLASVATEIRDEQAARDLVVVDPLITARRHALDAYVTEHLRLGPGRNVRVQLEAWRRGQEAADTLPLARAPVSP